MKHLENVFTVGGRRWRPLNCVAAFGWMMTCTDGRTPPADRQGIVHPRPYGAFSRKLRQSCLRIRSSVSHSPFAG